jgi:hypothetical protein
MKNTKNIPTRSQVKSVQDSQGTYEATAAEQKAAMTRDWKASMEQIGKW